MAIAVASPAVRRLAAALGLERCRSATISLGVDEVVIIRAQQYAEVNQLTRMAVELETNEYVVITRDEYDKLKADARPFADAAERSVPVSETGEGQSGMRTERVTLEITYKPRHYIQPKDWHWLALLKARCESVRVVDETHFDDLAQVAMERDAAIRERDKLRSEITSVRNCWGVSRFANDVLKARVAELEAASNSSAILTSSQAASGGGEQPRGWLTGKEREALESARLHLSNFDAFDEKTEQDARWASEIVAKLLARSTPPEVVLRSWTETNYANRVMSAEEVIAALAAIGVSVKEVGRE